MDLLRLSARILMAAGLACASAPCAAADQGSYEQAILAELNSLREHPTDYIASLSQYKAEFHANLVVVPGARYNLATEEGVRPVNEAISFLSRQSELGSLDETQRLASSAHDLVAEQSRSGDTGHYGADGSGPGDRVQRHGGDVYVSEVIAYGADSPRDVIRQLLVDDGVPDRGHRKALFDRQLRYAGVACGRHPVYRTVCVIDLAATPDGRLRGESHSHFLSLASYNPQSPGLGS